MRRRDFITLIGSTAAAWPRAAHAQQPERVRRIGVLMSFGANDPEAQSRAAAFENGLRQLGWVRGHNLSIEYRWADNPDVLRTYATELVGMAPDLILVNSTPAIAALQEQRQAVPIVFTQVTDPVGEGLVLNLAHPGGHVTGFTSFEFSIGTKWLEMLKEVAPRVMRVALIFNPETAPFAELFWRPVEAAAPSFAIVAISAGAPTFADLESMVDKFAREPNGSLMVLPDVSTLNYREALIGLAARHRLPTVYPFRIFAANGGLLSYGTDVNDVFRRVASYVDRLLKGADPGKLPIQSPNKYELVINLKTAKALDLELPPKLLALANEVIE
ncbi:MAG: ABC transporter substrate-binding protein [Xanthobacteraceae bacterium]|jgi:putative tryptophan/tyrosine transport system substrate-binding protein